MRTILTGIGIAIVWGGGAAVVLGQKLTLTPLTCPASIQSIGGCPDDGCGGLSDALLNRAKNRTDSPSTAPPIQHVHDIVDLEQPADWLTG